MKKKFRKNDSNKNRLELIEPEFIIGLGEVLTFGAKKYKADNWKKAASEEDNKRLGGAMLRHLYAYLGGEKKDPESGMSHLYHLAFGAMALDYFDKKQEKKR